MDCKAFLGKLSATVASIIKIVLLSRSCHHPQRVKEGSELVILGNGPSLNDTLSQSAQWLAQKQKLALNFAANTPVFTTLRPEYYVLADMHFFRGLEHDNVRRLWDSLNAVTWQMTLFVPVKAGSIPLTNSHVTVVRYNLTPVEGFSWLENFAFSHGLGMPRPRNVLIPSLMLALQLGFKRIYVAGADHTWTRTLSVDECNRVVSIQPHFYKEDDKERKRIDTEYMHYPLHQILYSFYVAFRSYHTIERYARECAGAGIYNITPGSFIDAFERKKV